MGQRKIINNTVYWVYGDKNKPVLIMIHGFRGTHHGLELIAKEIENDFFVIIPDLPGFGESNKLDSEHSIENYSKWLKAFIESLKLPSKPILLGHSFGSIVVSSFVSKYPEHINKLILVNPIGYPALKGPKIILSGLSAAYYQIGKSLPKSVSKKWLSSHLVTQIMSSTMAKTRDNKLRKYIHSQHHQHFSSFSDEQSVSESFKASINHNVREYVKSIPTNTLLIIGDMDDITPVHRQLELNNLFQNSKLEIIKNVGHLTHYEKPAEIADLIRKFLQ